MPVCGDGGRAMTVCCKYQILCYCIDATEILDVDATALQLPPEQIDRGALAYAPSSENRAR